MTTSDESEQLGDLFIPSLAFDSPLEIVEDPDLTIGEKRSILSAWASDAQAVKNSPGMRAYGRSQATIDDIIAALRLLDKFDENRITALALKAYRQAAIELFPSRSEEANRQSPAE